MANCQAMRTHELIPDSKSPMVFPVASVTETSLARYSAKTFLRASRTMRDSTCGHHAFCQTVKASRQSDAPMAAYTWFPTASASEKAAHLEISVTIFPVSLAMYMASAKSARRKNRWAATFFRQALTGT